MTRLLHTSDLHGNYKLPMRASDFDVWVDTGDFFPNITRGQNIEPQWQHDWFTRTSEPLRKKYMPIIRRLHPEHPQGWYPPKSRLPRGRVSVGNQLIDWLGGRPVVSVPGNHDWVNLAGQLKLLGYKNAYDLTKGPIELDGYRWAGFSQIPFVTGEWQGEIGSFFDEPGGDEQFRKIVAKAMTTHPDILLTHSPPYGILDYSEGKGGNAGIRELTKWLERRHHEVKLNLFGHIHEDGGKTLREMDILFVNSAQACQLIEVP
jgi:Icc-related predicted phosphoesterase